MHKYGFSPKRLSIFLPIFLVTLLSDQWTKIWAVEALKGRPPKFYFFGLIQILYAENRGAWGNLGAEWPEFLRFGFLIALPLLILIGMGGYTLSFRELHKREIIAFSCITAGGLGNLIDRIRYDFVVDFMYMGYGKLATNVFNIADVVIMTGFGFLALHYFLDWKKKKSDVSIDGRQES
jgi:signal peptidase II